MVRAHRRPSRARFDEILLGSASTSARTTRV